MEISFYVLLTIACLVLVLAMWACAASNTQKWGPDLTLELPPYLLQEALFRTSTNQASKMKQETIPSAPSEMLCDPLLNNEQPMGMNSPVQNYYRPVLMNASTAVRVLPARYVPLHNTRPTFYTFSAGEPA